MRALISVWDKTGVVDLAERLSGLGWEIVSSGGTAAALADAGVPVLAVEHVTGSPEMLDGRVKTLHPRIHGGILADRSKPGHAAALTEHGITAIDLVVCNLYPFRSDPSVELIDIGGPAMVRAAAKNHGDSDGGVGVVVDPSDYTLVLDELTSNGALSCATRRTLARTAFAHTAAYDAAIVQWLDEPQDAPQTDTSAISSSANSAGSPTPLPPTVHLALERVDACRYGENPHQQGARYRPVGAPVWWDHAYQHSGLALSYLNFFDADAAWRIAHDLGDAEGAAAVVIVKHANPCGAAAGGDLADVYQRAYDCDTRSAFGGIVAFNRIVDLETVECIEAAAQADVILAPGYEDGVAERIAARRRNTRVLEAPRPDAAGLSLRQMNGGWLVQSPHTFASPPEGWRVVTRRTPTESELADARFAWRVCGHVTSNAIVLARDRTAWGIGAGQQNRVESGRLAMAKADGRAAGGACASDAFYPFPDGVEAAAEAGVAVVVQPGGAQRDDDVIDRADELGLAMLFTGERQFRH
ncbi:bifunctional phosphoribosylaminoimidazolecarboxamide formyltransferase/IMP cyclohydrolase [Candidatus Poriferisodalis sp.]|uniref:bifunctional phosphoribosylaminoimidazolecarboxamide formyltransferase/IMP cyclohydrolase n=1 Tax=Candidatus Poriferisodalis sp. TaxID=3101277 RepID=UPI003B02BA08